MAAKQRKQAAAGRRPGNQQEQNPQAQRVLRVGVILGGKIVEERLIRDRKEVSIGQSSKNTFAVPVDGLPRVWSLFAVQNDKYYLNYSDTMDGRVSDGSEVHTLAALKGKGAQRRNGGWTIPLPDSARGKIIVGDLTLLFQFVAEPPRQPRPHLPASVRGTFADRLDPTLSVILAISLLIHFSIGLYAYQRDRVIQKRTTRIFNETFQRPTVAMADLQPLEEAPKGDTENKDKADKTEDKQPKKSNNTKKSDKGKAGPKSDKPAGRSAEENLRLQEEAIRYADGLFSDDLSDSGIGGPSSDRDPRNDLAEAIRDIKRSGDKVADIGSGSNRGTRGDGSSRIGTGEGPNVEGPGDGPKKTTPKTKERVPRTRVKVGGGSSDDDTSLSPDAVMRKIRTAYMNGLKRCHKDILKRDPSAGGRVTLTFTIGETGRVVRVKARGFDSTVDACIEKRARSWRFGIPKDEDGDATDAIFKVSLVLSAE